MARRTNRRPRSRHVRRSRSQRPRPKQRRTRKKYSKLSRMNWFTRKHPIATGVILIILALVLFRLSFSNVFLNSVEIFGWSIVISIGLFLAGLLILIGWWRNNISMLTTRHNVRMR